MRALLACSSMTTCCRPTSPGAAAMQWVRGAVQSSGAEVVRVWLAAVQRSQTAVACACLF